jgi:hypothetical protein
MKNYLKDFNQKYHKYIMEKIIRVGKRNTIHLPKAIVKELGLTTFFIKAGEDLYISLVNPNPSLNEFEGFIKTRTNELARLDKNFFQYQ